MQKTANNRSQNPDSYDIWENGCRNYLKRSSATLQNIESLPLIPFRVMDVTRIDNCWFQHVNYQYMALELILNGTAEYQTEHETLIAPPACFTLLQEAVMFAWSTQANHNCENYVY